MKNFRLSVISMCFVACTSYAQTTIPGLMSDLGTSLSESARLQGEMNGFTLENERLMKENKVLADNRDQQKKEYDAIFAQSKADIEAAFAQKQAEINRVVAQWDSFGCTGQLPQAKYDWCIANKPVYQAQIDGMKKNGDDYIKDRIYIEDATKLKPKRDVMARQTWRIDQIAITMKSNFDKFAADQTANIALQAKIAQIRAQLADLCTNARAGSASYQLCTGANWDGKRTDLPPLTGPRKGTTIVPNQ